MTQKSTYILSALKHTTFKKLRNLLRIQFQKIFTKGNVSAGSPAILVFDPSSVCNLHCPLCPTGQGRTERSKGIADFDNYKKIIDEVGDYLYFAQFTNWGEPIANKDLARMIRYARDKNIETILRTNLTLADKITCEKLVRAGLDEIIISLDGATSETYLKYRQGGNFKKVIENIKNLVAFKRQLNSPIRIIWQFIVSSENEHEIPLALKLSKELHVILRTVPLRVDMGKEVSEDRQTQISKDFRWLPKDEKYSRYNYKKKQNKYFEKTCRWLWTKTVVNWNGSVSPCCAIWEEEFDFGNAFESGLMAVWNNEKYQKAREIVRTRRGRRGIICSKCLINGFVN